MSWETSQNVFKKDNLCEKSMMLSLVNIAALLWTAEYNIEGQSNKLNKAKNRMSQPNITSCVVITWTAASTSCLQKRWAGCSHVLSDGSWCLGNPPYYCQILIAHWKYLLSLLLQRSVFPWVRAFSKTRGNR